jgi:hypothetical protein
MLYPVSAKPCPELAMQFQVSAMLYRVSGLRSRAFQRCRGFVSRALVRGSRFRGLVQEFRFVPCQLNRQACYRRR